MPDDEDPRRAYPRTRTKGQRVINAVEIENDILNLSDAMEETLTDFENRGVEAANAEHAYKLKKSKATLEASTRPGNGRDGRTTVDEREAMVIRDCDKELLAHLIAEALYATAKQTLNVQQSRMDSLRTLAANLRSQT